MPPKNDNSFSPSPLIFLKRLIIIILTIFLSICASIFYNFQTSPLIHSGTYPGSQKKTSNVWYQNTPHRLCFTKIRLFAPLSFSLKPKKLNCLLLTCLTITTPGRKVYFAFFVISGISTFNVIIKYYAHPKKFIFYQSEFNNSVSLRIF